MDDASPDPLGVTDAGPTDGAADATSAADRLGVTHHRAAGSSAVAGGSTEVGSPRSAPTANPAPADLDAEGPPAFYYDFRDPWSYLAAERVLQTLPVATPWVPIDASRLPGPHAWEGFRCEADHDAYRERVAQVVRERGLQPLRWPVEVPFNSRKALLTAWYAKGIGRVVSFSLPAFRQAFAGGHDLAHETYVLLAASACEMHPRAVVQAFGRPTVAAELDAATERAVARGVTTVPAVWTGDRVFHGDEQLEAAAAHLTPPERTPR